MRFHPDSDQLAIQDAVAGTLGQVFPRERLMEFIDDDSDHDRATWQALMELGFAGLMLPEADGGAGLGLFEAALVMEALGKGAAPGPVIGQLLAVLACQLSDAPAAKAALPGLAAGEMVASFAFGGDWLPTGWDVAFDNGTASGEVRFVACVDLADAFLVGIRGGGLALVRTGDGVSVERCPSTDRSRPVSRLSLTNAAAEMLLEPGDTRIGRVFDAGLVLLAADSLGGAQHCTDLSVDYAQERHQFGQPIARFQALKHQLATMALSVEPARSLVWYAAYAWDQELADAPRSAALAKSHVCDRFTQVARDAIAAHGGIGYTWEHGLNVWLRRSVFNRAVLGSPAVHRARAADLAGW